MQHLKRAFVAILLVVAVPLVLIAQGGTISGIVQDLDGEAIGGVEITLYSNPPVVAKTTDKGEFVFKDLAPGVYDLAWDKTGWNFMGGSGRRVRLAPSGLERVKVEAQLFWWATLLRSYVAVVALAVLLGAHVCFLINIFVLVRPTPALTAFGGILVALSSYMILGKLDQAWKIPMMTIVVLTTMTMYYIGKNWAAKRPAGVPHEAAARDQEILTREKQQDQLLESLVGKEGLTASCLKMFGKIEVDGRLYDAKSARGFLDKGMKVTIAAREGDCFVVEPATATQ